MLMLISISFLNNIHPLELLIIPITVLLGNFFEYLIHKGPMHHPKKGVAIIYTNHTILHHNLFIENAMPYENQIDFKMILLSPLMLFIVLCILTIPNGFLLVQYVSLNVGLLFIASSVCYLLLYEIFHLMCHLKDNSFFYKIQFISNMRLRHGIHHDMKIMTEKNFNIFLPVYDILFNTIKYPNRT